MVGDQSKVDPSWKAFLALRGQSFWCGSRGGGPQSVGLSRLRLLITIRFVGIRAYLSGSGVAGLACRSSGSAPSACRVLRLQVWMGSLSFDECLGYPHHASGF